VGVDLGGEVVVGPATLLGVENTLAELSHLGVGSL
jgi:hypothetical protein